MAQPHRPLGPQPLAIRPAMAQDIAHALDAYFLHRLPQVQTDDAGDTAHGGLPTLDHEHGLVELNAVVGDRDLESVQAGSVALERTDTRRRLPRVPSRPDECHDPERQHRYGR